MDMNYLSNIQTLIQSWGVSSSNASLLVRPLLTVLLIIVGFAVHYIARRYLLRLLHIIAQRTSNQWDNVLLKHKVFELFIHLVPAFFIYCCAVIIFPETPRAVNFIQALTMAYAVGVICLSVYRLLDASHDIYNTFEISHSRPIKAYIQVVKIIVTVVGLIFGLAVLLDKSPWGLLSGLGALTAIFMLVFRDSILGFVASIQLVANNMVRPGDWIEMPKFGADGDVIDVSLATVKVQNWDKTISTIPTYALVSDSFKNWRGMTESGGRRIKRSLSVDMHSVSFCTPELLARLKKIKLLEAYIVQKEQELTDYNREHSINEDEPVNGRRLTNLGCFRAYIERYLRSNPKIHKEMTLLVRQLQPTERGLPIEIYVFSNDQGWINYEAIQADIFDHLLATVSEFDLRIFQNPGGAEIEALLKRCA